MSDSAAIASIIQKAQNGDVAAFEEIVSRYEKTVYNITLRMTGNVDDAKEITQEIFIKLYQNIEKFEGKSQFGTWVHRISVNMTIDEIRKRKRYVNISIDEEIETGDGSMLAQYADPNPEPQDRVMENEQKQLITKALQSLNEEHRIVITLRDLKQLSYAEIADVLELNEGTVKSRISRARLSLKNILLSMEQMKGYLRHNE